MREYFLVLIIGFFECISACIFSILLEIQVLCLITPVVNGTKNVKKICSSSMLRVVQYYYKYSENQILNNSITKGGGRSGRRIALVVWQYLRPVSHNRETHASKNAYKRNVVSVPNIIYYYEIRSTEIKSQ